MLNGNNFFRSHRGLYLGSMASRIHSSRAWKNQIQWITLWFMVISLTFAWIGIHEFIFLAFLLAKQAINNNNSNIIGVWQTKERKICQAEVKHILANFRIFYHSFQLIDFHKILAWRRKKFVSAFERRKKVIAKVVVSIVVASFRLWRRGWHGLLA